MNKNIGDMTESELKDFIIELQEENSIYERINQKYKEVILKKYIDLIDKGYCSDCNELNCIDNFPHAKITHAIRELQQENQKYKEVIDKAIEYINDNLIISSILDGKKYYTINDYSFDYKELLDILKEVE